MYIIEESGRCFVGRYLKHLLDFYNRSVAMDCGKLDYRTCHRRISDGRPYKGLHVRKTSPTDLMPRGMVVYVE